MPSYSSLGQWGFPITIKYCSTNQVILSWSTSAGTLRKDMWRYFLIIGLCLLKCIARSKLLKWSPSIQKDSISFLVLNWIKRNLIFVEIWIVWILWSYCSLAKTIAISFLSTVWSFCFTSSGSMHMSSAMQVFCSLTDPFHSWHVFLSGALKMDSLIPSHGMIIK